MHCANILLENRTHTRNFGCTIYFLRILQRLFRSSFLESFNEFAWADFFFLPADVGRILAHTMARLDSNSLFRPPLTNFVCQPLQREFYIVGNRNGNSFRIGCSTGENNLVQDQ